ncbi:hypothetical protein KXD40_005523 [Peronospora effusa]|nr:hypothetical protein KXD40_005523 [Peronospora effusa]
MVLEAGVVGIGLVRGTFTYVNVFVQASFSSDTGFRRATPTSHTSSFRLTLLNQVRCTREVVDSQDWLDAHEDKRRLVPPQCRRERQQLSFRCHCFDRSFAGLMYHGDQGN